MFSERRSQGQHARLDMSKHTCYGVIVAHCGTAELFIVEEGPWNRHFVQPFEGDAPANQIPVRIDSIGQLVGTVLVSTMQLSMLSGFTWAGEEE